MQYIMKTMDRKLNQLVVLVLLLKQGTIFAEADVTSVVGSTISLYCTLSPTQTQKVQWFKGTLALSYGDLVLPDLKPDELRNRLGITVDNGKYHLNISNLVKTDEGQYTCAISGTVDTEQKLIVIVGPTSVSFENKDDSKRLQGDEGQNLRIRCLAVGGDPKPDVIIKTEKTGQEYSGTSGVREVIIPTIDRAFDGSQVTCRTDYSRFPGFVYEPKTDQAIIYLNLKPLPPTISPDPISTTNIEQLALTCRSTGSRPNPTNRIWLLGDGNIDITTSSTGVHIESDLSHTDTYIATSTLTYTFDKQYNGKSITCGFSNTATGNNFVKSSKQIEVQYAPEITVQNKTFEPSQMSREIQCVLDGNPSTYTYGRWEHKSKYGDHIRYLPAAPTLTLPVVSEAIRYQDTGEYVCTANNGIVDSKNKLDQKGSGFVVSKAPPFFLNGSSQTVLGQTRNDVTIDVSVYSEPKFTSHTWYKDGSQISHGSKYVMSNSDYKITTTFHGFSVQVDGYKLTLTIKNLEENDFANYTVEIANGVGGQVEHLVVLLSASPPDTPTDFNITRVKGASVTVEWKPAFDGGHQQSFVVQYRISGAEDWQNASVPNSVRSSQGVLQRFTLANLIGLTLYELRMFAINKFNPSSPTEIVETVTGPAEGSKSAAEQTGVIIGGVAGGLLLILIAIGLVFLFMKRRKGSGSSGKKKPRSQEDVDDGSYGLKDNILYKSVEMDYGKKQEQSDENKPSAVYAEVVKPKQKPNDKVQNKNKKGKKHQEKGKPKTKAMNNNTGDVYANSGAPLNDSQESEYANSEQPIVSSNINAQGLEYADITFINPPKTKPGPPGRQPKPVIHGDEDRTIYSEVDHTKKAPPIPQEGEYEMTDISKGKQA